MQLTSNMKKILFLVSIAILAIFISCKDDDPIPPINANFSASQLTVLEGSSITFTDLSTNSPENWEWEFEGGTPQSSTNQNPTVRYDTPGIYDVKLTAAKDGSSDDETKADFITVAQSLMAEFGLSNAIINQGEDITFSDQSLGTPASYEWSFEGGEPATSSEANPTVSYATPGVYEVTLKVINDLEPAGNSITKEIAVLPTSGLTAYYPFNENADDQSGNGFNGTLNNGTAAVADRNQEENQAYSFDGVDDYIVTSTEIDQSLGTGATFSAWIYLSDVGSTARVLSNYNGTGAVGNCVERIGFVFGVTADQQLNMFYAIDGNDFDGRMTASGSLETNQWYHVLGTWDGSYSPSGFRLYINGAQRDVEDQEEGFVSCGGFLESLNPFHIGIGHCATGFCAPFNGSIDEVRIYDRPLSETEILALSKS